MGRDGEHRAHRLHDSARRQSGERVRDGGNQVLIVEPLRNRRLVEDDDVYHVAHFTASLSGPPPPGMRTRYLPPLAPDHRSSHHANPWRRDRRCISNAGSSSQLTTVRVALSTTTSTRGCTATSPVETGQSAAPPSCSQAYSVSPEHQTRSTRGAGTRGDDMRGSTCRC